MNINLTQHGPLILLLLVMWVATITILSNDLAKRKTRSVKLVSITGFVLAFIPPIALLYVGVLALRKDNS